MVYEYWMVYCYTALAGKVDTLKALENTIESYHPAAKGSSKDIQKLVTHTVSKVTYRSVPHVL